MKDERDLDAKLAALARADAGATAPPRVEAALAARLARVRRARRWPLVAGAAAALGTALWLAIPGKPPQLPQPVAQRPVAAPLGGGFLPIAAFAPELEEGRIVRMEVPAGLVVSFGWPLPAEDDRPRTAEVLFGEDGVARAIRFLPASFRTGR
jgi:hypothetical protein